MGSEGVRGCSSIPGESWVAVTSPVVPDLDPSLPFHF